MIRRAASHDLDAVEQVYMQRLIWERKNERYSGWIAGVYPSRTVLRRAIARGELYALWDGTEIVGAMSLTRGQPEAYEQLRWPVRGREGLGTQMLHYAIGLAQRTRARAVRLDCLERNMPMIALLEKTGFVLAAKKAAPCPAGSDEETRWYEYDTVPPRDVKRAPR